MDTNGDVFRRIPGPLQRHVYLILTLPIFFTALTFFVDVFTLHITPCSEDTTWNRTVERNVSTGDLGSGQRCAEANQFARGQATFMTGLLIGSLFSGAISDKYGKKVVLICCAAVHAVVSVIVAFLPFLPVYLSARGISGVTCCAIHICTYRVEWSLPKLRIWPPTIFSFIFSLGMMALAAVAFLSSSWMQFHLALGIPQILFLPLYFYLPESPRWLLLNRKMKTIENYQNRSTEDKHHLALLLESLDNKIQKSLPEKPSMKTKSSFTNLTSPIILLRITIMSYIGYEHLCIRSDLLWDLLQRWKFWSKYLSCTFFLWIIRGAFFAASIPVEAMGPQAVHNVLAVTQWHFLYAVPPCGYILGYIMQQKCIGLVSLCYRVASVINAVMSPEDGIPLPAMISYSSGPIIGAALCLLLPETSGIPLPDTVEDCKKQPRLMPKCFDRCQHAADASFTEEEKQKESLPLSA
ncbi:hypothetical protein DNTS_027401 [Danionella cerebrum]|uniref:Major facilitator superfamily (MFS) profile domain-containing protein n=1 Tax=Danionella cerebrum TaxID=2873325 RepID=A0A553N2M4_9TELE|nr:hypothetical protein DNTS_027401 [Danionella translucida]